ncbi:MAG: carboxymuconolactone decarboxylase family protein [Pseudomonadota bacterium]
MSEPSDAETKGRDLIGTLIGGIPANSVMPPAFQKLTLEQVFGGIWQDDRLDFQQHSMITCVVLVALNREAEQRIHFRGAKNLGVPRDQIEAMISHVAYYAGWPCAVSAFRVLKEVWPDDANND